MKTHFQMMARYNSWANLRLYDAAAKLPDEFYRRDIGLFFRSLHGTLNHLLTTDRIWMHRIDGKGPGPTRLDAIQHENFAELREARMAEDARIEDPLRTILAHLFNHQTHHHGQAHTGLSILTGAEPPPIDLLPMLRLEKASRRP